MKWRYLPVESITISIRCNCWQKPISFVVAKHISKVTQIACDFFHLLILALNDSWLSTPSRKKLDLSLLPILLCF